MPVRAKIPKTKPKTLKKPSSKPKQAVSRPVSHQLKRFAGYLKHWVVPQAGNNHRPHALTPKALAAWGILILGLQLGYNLQLTGRPAVLSYATDINSSDLITYTNQQRTAEGLSVLTPDSSLNQAAAAKAAHMFANDYWAHIAPDGTQPWYFFQQVGYDYQYAGENLAKGFMTSSGTVAGWMASPGHKANILNVNYRDIGIGIANGTLQGQQVTLVVALYGSRLGAAAASPAPPAPAPAAAVKPAVAPPKAVPAPAPAPPPAAAPAPVPPPAAAPAPAPAATPSKPLDATPVATGQSMAPVAEPPAGLAQNLARPFGQVLVLGAKLGTIPLLSIVLLLMLAALYVSAHFFGRQAFAHLPIRDKWHQPAVHGLTAAVLLAGTAAWLALKMSGTIL